MISRPLRLALRIAAGTVLILLGTVAAAWFAAPRFAEDPMEELKRHTPVRIYLDRTGRPVRMERTYDAEWRFEVPLRDIPEHTVRTILAAEDSGFFHHGGVDYAAVFRAFGQNLRSGRIVSGASTLSMQLASMAHPGRKRSLWTKILQAVRARRLESLHSKEEILEEYLNRIPFGGKIFGIEAAAQYYFGRPAKELTLAETALLCGLPQRPNAYRPDRHPEEARKRQKRVLDMLERKKLIGPGEAEKLFAEPLRFRDFSRQPEFMTLGRNTETFSFFRHARKEANNAFLVRTSFDPEKHAVILRMLRDFIRKDPGPKDAAAVLLDNASGEILVCIGSTDFTSRDGGQVDAAMARRTAGSVLKPFLYREAVRAGILTSDTILSDQPLRFRDYTPGNADGGFTGDITAGKALRQSLNTPAIRLLAALGVRRTAGEFAVLGLLADPRKAEQESGLSLALGTAGHTLFSIVRAYTVFTGPLTEPTFLHGETGGQTVRSLPDPASAMIAFLLSSGSPLPGTEFISAWKTGTSSGGRDAWCAAFTPEYTLGIWFGNKDGSSVPGLTGMNTAAVCAGAVFQMLCRQETPGILPNETDERFFEPVRLCSRTGMRATADCARTRDGIAARGIPLHSCRACAAGSRKPLRILFPKSGNYQAGPDGTVRLRFEAANGRAAWFLDSAWIGEVDPSERIQVARGPHTVTAVPADDPETPPSSVSILVE